MARDCRVLVRDNRSHHAGSIAELMNIPRVRPAHEVDDGFPGFTGRAEGNRTHITTHSHSAISFSVFNACRKADSISAPVNLLGSLAVSMSDPIATKISLRMRRPSRPSATFAR